MTDPSDAPGDLFSSLAGARFLGLETGETGQLMASLRMYNNGRPVIRLVEPRYLSDAMQRIEEERKKREAILADPTGSDPIVFRLCLEGSAPYEEEAALCAMVLNQFRRAVQWGPMQATLSA